MAQFGELLHQAEQIAIGRKGDSSASVVLDSMMTAEQLYTPALCYVIGKLLKSGSDMLQDIIKYVGLTVSGGAGVLPANVVKEALDYAYFRDRKYVSVVSYADFKRSSLDNLTDYFAVTDSGFRYKQSGTPSYTGLLHAYLPICPDKPTSAAADCQLTNRLVIEMVLTIAAALTGELPIQELMNNGVKI